MQIKIVFASSGDPNVPIVHIKSHPNGDEYTDLVYFFPKGVHLNATQPHFRPVVDDDDGTHPNAIRVLDINDEGSDITIETLTSDLCDTFNNIMSISGENINLQNIDSNAFEHCKNLKYVHFSRNHITKLDENIFKGNPNLLGVRFSQNQIQSLNPMVFHDKPLLSFIDLTYNFLTVFPVKQMSPLNSLDILFLAGNPLKDIDAEEIVKKFPALTGIELCPNSKIVPSRLEQLNNFFKTRNVKLNMEMCY